MKFSIKYDYDLQTKQYIAEVPELNLSDYGDTIEEADKNLKQALQLYFEEIIINNEALNTKKLQYA